MARTGLGVGIYLFADVEVLDFAAPFEVFTTSNRVSQRLEPQQPEPFKVFSVAENLAPVRARAGLHLLPDYTVADHPPIDVLVIPGGVVTAELQKPAVLQWVKQQATTATQVASVCTGAFILAGAGVINSGPVTTHREDQASLARLFPALNVIDGVRWVTQGRVITSAGIAAGLDMSLHLVGLLASVALARATAQQMEYPWPVAD